LTEVDFAVIGDKTIPIGKSNVAVVQVDVSRKLLEGFTASEMESGKAKEPPVHVYFSHDERLLPLLFELPLWMGTARAVLAKECGKDESCLLGNSN
jgi:hypothetical protein